ncbi:hypothetical protein C2G38_2064518 [Gigaspora rosea]|uniref:Uncharacterized protein n=1 Tax=Gigaspora rosea TaxID=44941 RepID=A0A397VZ23_9GLOM|nr:hypothetical protein C2G38_2064518 [Gigaspora rosea]
MMSLYVILYSILIETLIIAIYQVTQFTIQFEALMHCYLKEIHDFILYSLVVTIIMTVLEYNGKYVKIGNCCSIHYCSFTYLYR